jgi:diguanylate cyclase (GGDEF)-like protein
VDELTRLPNLRGFVSIAEHHLRMADRTGTPTVLLFLRLDGYEDVVASLGSTGADDLVRDAAEVLLTAIREADLPARIAPDTFCVLLSGEASGAEVTVLSRLVEAIALHDTVKPDPGPLALSVGTALYDPATPVGLERLLETAQAGLQADPSGAR